MEQLVSTMKYSPVFTGSTMPRGLVEAGIQGSLSSVGHTISTSSRALEEAGVQNALIAADPLQLAHHSSGSELAIRVQCWPWTQMILMCPKVPSMICS